jgi:hypothetical protein
MYHSREEILNYRRHHTLEQTGLKFNMSGERVRQIQLLKNRKTCKIHKRYYFNRCSYCVGMKYKDFLRWQNYAFIEKECAKEAKKARRDYLSVQKKTYLIEILRDRYSKSWQQIAIMLQRDRTSILNLYNKYVRTN